LHRILILILACASAFLLSACKAKTSQLASGPPAVPVTTAAASTQPAPLEIRVIGTVEPSSKVEIKSQIAGQLVSVHFTEGQEVDQGQLLFKIDSEPYNASVRQAEGAIERDRAMLNQAESAVLRDIVQSKAADAEAARYAALLKDRLVSTQQNLQYLTTAEASKETIRASQAAVQSARASLKMDEAALARAKLELSYTEIRAPIVGRAGNLLVHMGNLVKANDVPLVVINRIKPVFVSFNAPEQYLQAIRQHSSRRQLPVRVISRDDPGTISAGYLSLIDNTVDTQTGTVHLKAKFDNANRQLWPGQFVNVVLTLDSVQNATVVPAEAVQAGQQGQFVYIVKPDRTVEPRVVSVGRTLEHNVIIDNGVKPGETVVTDGQMLLFPGAHITIASAPKQPAGAQ
jgi:multidrug efflux system membrane fusion protein